MHLRHESTRWVVAAPAKINLTLEVIGRRDDGFHNLETLVSPVSLFDSLAFEPLATGSAGRFSLSVVDRIDRRAGCDSSKIPTGPENLVVRAVSLLANRAGIERGARLKLIKRIPMEAGLGGGSSDAAAALIAANAAWGLDWPRARLVELAAELGSDVPSFLTPGPTVCRGRGELVESVGVPAGIPIVIAKPAWGLSTAQVFDRWQTSSSNCITNWQAAAASLTSRSWSTLASAVGNALQSIAMKMSPGLRRLRQAFLSVPVVAHQMSGSGSAWFGICSSWREARRAAAGLLAMRCGAVYAVVTCP